MRCDVWGHKKSILKAGIGKTDLRFHEEDALMPKLRLQNAEEEKEEREQRCGAYGEQLEPWRIKASWLWEISCAVNLQCQYLRGSETSPGNFWSQGSEDCIDRPKPLDIILSLPHLTSVNGGKI